MATSLEQTQELTRGIEKHVSNIARESKQWKENTGIINEHLSKVGAAAEKYTPFGRVINKYISDYSDKLKSQKVDVDITRARVKESYEKQQGFSDAFKAAKRAGNAEEMKFYKDSMVKQGENLRYYTAQLAKEESILGLSLKWVKSIGIALVALESVYKIVRFVAEYYWSINKAIIGANIGGMRQLNLVNDIMKVQLATGASTEDMLQAVSALRNNSMLLTENTRDNLKYMILTKQATGLTLESSADLLRTFRAFGSPTRELVNSLVRVVALTGESAENVKRMMTDYARMAASIGYTGKGVVKGAEEFTKYGNLVNKRGGRAEDLLELTKLASSIFTGPKAAVLGITPQAGKQEISVGDVFLGLRKQLSGFDRSSRSSTEIMGKIAEQTGISSEKFLSLANAIEQVTDEDIRQMEISDMLAEKNRKKMDIEKAAGAQMAMNGELFAVIGNKMKIAAIDGLKPVMLAVDAFMIKLDEFASSAVFKDIMTGLGYVLTTVGFIVVAIVKAVELVYTIAQTWYDFIVGIMGSFLAFFYDWYDKGFMGAVTILAGSIDNVLRSIRNKFIDWLDSLWPGWIKGKGKPSAEAAADRLQEEKKIKESYRLGMQNNMPEVRRDNHKQAPAQSFKLEPSYINKDRVEQLDKIASIGQSQLDLQRESSRTDSKLVDNGKQALRMEEDSIRIRKQAIAQNKMRYAELRNIGVEHEYLLDSKENILFRQYSNA